MSKTSARVALYVQALPHVAFSLLQVLSCFFWNPF